ncbi:glucose 1-dehydrogenase [Thermosporothrix hazakensis]|jgi:NAD(P)-dependent dehydrogenase (short-subunit alcohol dehydrogenase family)|uniref:Glucose 1-dehydrogenase n=1 Tax=Thermosporothrix hazakensis TaxID=644383 RepID=A0A326U9H3_THEHA|nr:SDR family oxidoreductase [Thermosporothrix hazakensis]PZW32680.1 glucose 1-dehydrogenase [Thermosporothrix hazakensis]GCE50033.1 dehydrogenase [Thermosporothrix hazakensis]
MLQNKRIIVTGATSGIGRAIALEAARHGADIAFCGLTEEGAAEVIHEIEKCGRRSFFRALDLSNLDEARRFTRDAIAFLGGLDGVVNNAGANFFHSVLKAKLEDVQRCFAVDFYPAWAICQEAYEELKACGNGIIVNMASIHAERTFAGTFPYNAAKAALVALTKSLAIEWGPDNIKAIAIAPAMIMTSQLVEDFNSSPEAQAELRRLETHYAVRRAGTPEDVASLVTYLLSGVNQFLSGTTIHVDGGINAIMESPRE